MEAASSLMIMRRAVNTNGLAGYSTSKRSTFILYEQAILYRDGANCQLHLKEGLLKSPTTKREFQALQVDMPSCPTISHAIPNPLAST